MKDTHTKKHPQPDVGPALELRALVERDQAGIAQPRDAGIKDRIELQRAVEAVRDQVLAVQFRIRPQRDYVLLAVVTEIDSHWGGCIIRPDATKTTSANDGVSYVRDSEQWGVAVVARVGPGAVLNAARREAPDLVKGQAVAYKRAEAIFMRPTKPKEEMFQLIMVREASCGLKLAWEANEEQTR